MTGYDWPRLHALLNDLPSALLVTAVFFDLFGTFGKRPGLRQAGFWALIVGAVGGVLAVVSGLQAEGYIAHGGAVHEVMEHHETLAFITLAVFGVLAVWRIVRDARAGNGERRLMLAVSLAGVGVLVATGKQGARLVFEHAAGVPTDVLQAELHERGRGHHHGAGASDEHAEEAGESQEGESHEHDDGVGAGHSHGEEPATAPMASDSAPAATRPPDHVDPPGTPPHSHPSDSSHSHPAGTPPHGH